MTNMRPEFPRPDFIRDSWQSLNGEWQFMFDPHKEHNYLTTKMDMIINVPFCYESELSGIGKWIDSEVVWYKRSFEINSTQLKAGAVLLSFGAVDYQADVWVNNIYVGQHKGGYSSFSFDIAEQICLGKNTIIVKATDDLRTDKPRGKQSWTGEKFGCWYTPVTGIWQSVWLEFTGSIYLQRIDITPDFDKLIAHCDLYISSNHHAKARIRATIEQDGSRIELAESFALVTNGFGKAALTFPDQFKQMLAWSPENPNLIDVDVTLECDNNNLDLVKTYFGLRKISVQDDVILFNNAPLFQRLILDQGYWHESLLTPPSDEAIINDIKLIKSMGFNGVRKHQKIEDPRFYYWADKLGLLVWGELPSHYLFNKSAIINAHNEMAEFIQRDYNHPSIITWVTLNESWGVRAIQSNQQQQDFARSLYYLTKSLDSTRLISSNDGWEQVDTSDICAMHDYAIFADNVEKYDDVMQVIQRGLYGRMVYCDSANYTGKPIMMTEYGGIAFSDSSEEEWGYFGRVKDEDEFLSRLEPVTDIFIKSRKYAGFCYTQLTDVHQEVNGLLDIHRKPKIPLAKLKHIFGKVIH